MSFFKNFSIQNKLISILVIISIFSLGIAFTFVILRDVKNFKKEMVENTFTIAQVIGDLSVADLTFRDPKSSEQTLVYLKSLPYVDFACIYQAEGQVFSMYSKNKTRPNPPRRERSSFNFKDGYLHIFHPIDRDGKHLGTIYLRSSTAALDEKVNRDLLTMVGVMIAVLFLAFLFSMPLQRLISRPILHLAQVTKKVSEEADYTLRMKSESNDEIGILYEGFNSMLSQLQGRERERDRAEAALKESEQRYRSLVESSPEAIFVEQNDNIVYMNPSGLLLLGYESLSEVEGKKLNSLIAGFSNLDLTAPSATEAKFIRKDGKFLDVEVTFFGTTYQGEPAIQGLARDITESKNLRIAAQRMERLAALGELSATLAHEIRNSLGSISLNFRNLSERLDIPDPYQRTFNNIELGIHRIQDIINGILNFARPVQPSLRKVDVRKVIDSSLHSVERELEGSDVKIIRKYDSEIPQVMIDPGQIHQVLINLYLNSKQAMPSGGTLVVQATHPADYVEVIVEDTGKGIPSENLEKIFNPFFTTRSEGIGLGLAIVSRILEQHKSQIFVQSKTGSGTKFSIRFPTQDIEIAVENTTIHPIGVN